MLSYTATFIVYLIIMLISYIFYSKVAEKKMSAPICLLIGFLLFELLGASCNIIFKNTISINAIITFIVDILFGSICFKIRKSRVVFYSSILNVLAGTLEYVVIFTVSSVFKVPPTIYNDNIFMLCLITAASKLTYLAAVLILARAVKKDTNNVKMPPRFYILPLTVFFSMTVFWHICTHDIVSDSNKILFSAVCALLCISAVVLFITYQNNIEKENKFISLENVLEKVHTDEQYYDLLRKKNEQLMLFAHDTKNHLTAMKSFSDDEELNKYIDSLNDDLVQYSNISLCKNKMIDSIVSRYITECEMKNITFVYNVKSCNLSYIADTDIIAMLSNVMNNAVEAAIKSENRFISFTINFSNHYEVITVENSCDEKPIQKDGVYLTSKSDKINHGFGLKSAAQTALKYDGDFYNTYDEKEKMFKTVISVRSPD